MKTQLHSPAVPICLTAALTALRALSAGFWTALRRAARLLPLLLLWALPAVVQAQEDYTYTTNNGTITITGYTGPGGAVTIPSTITGLPVTRIGDAAFGNTSLTSVTIPNSVTIIENGAFYNCTSLTEVTIGNSVTNIGPGAFSGCASLTSITIPNSVTTVGGYYSWGGAFANCSGLTNVTLGNSVTNIGEYAFVGCMSLTSITIPNSVTTIGDTAFADCTSLTAITVDALNPVYSSEAGVLFNQSQTTLIQYPGGKAGSYTIPNTVTSIGDFAFRDRANLTNVTIGNSVTNIGNAAFHRCISLTSVMIGNSVTSIGDDAFSSCHSLIGVTIPDSVTSIGDYAFQSCTSLTGVYFKGDAPFLGSNVFNGANNATVYYLPGTTGWDTTFGGRPTALWVLPYPLILNSGPDFGVQTSGFGFIISWATDVAVVVEASPDLSNSVWTPVSTNTLTGGSSYFNDPQWTNHPNRFYRLVSLP